MSSFPGCAFTSVRMPGVRSLGQKRVHLGRRLRNSRADWETVVGVVGDVKETALSQAAPGQIYEPHAVVPDRLLEAATIPFFKTMNLVSRSASSASVRIRQLTSVLRGVDPSLAISAATTLGEVVADSSRSQRLNVFLIGCFAGIALVLAVLGVASVLAYSVVQRAYEIGIRIALGATPSRVFGMILGRGVALAATGIAAGVGASLAVSQFVAAFLYEVSPRDSLTFLAVPLVLIAAAAAAAWIPARRASFVDPMDSLRAGE